ncbi:hypothetical protein FACS1894204_13340 [Synergistales bacterium]|nr:hypothetical protein FACS1894204_13340 [Synergistales bacterium]
MGFMRNTYNYVSGWVWWFMTWRRRRRLNALINKHWSEYRGKTCLIYK